MQADAIEADESDAGKPKGSPVRSCIVSRASKPVAELIRFVRGPDGHLVPDLKASLPGRGVWVSADRASIAAAVKQKSFARALKRDVRVSPTLADDVGGLLLQRARESLALANKGGDIISGMFKVDEALTRRPLALLHASDGSQDGMQKLDRRYQAIVGAEARIFNMLPGADLDMALGRSNVVHAAIMDDSAGRACVARFVQAARFLNDLTLPLRAETDAE